MLGGGLLKLLLVAVLSTTLPSSSSSTSSAPFSTLLLLLELGSLFVPSLNDTKLICLLPVLSGSLSPSPLAFPGKEHSFDDVSDCLYLAQFFGF